MVVTEEGLRRFVDLVSADIDEGELGTGDDIPDVSDTDLATGVASTELTLTSLVSYDYPCTITKKYVLPSNGDNNTYAEFGLRNNANDKLYLRVIFTKFTKTDYEEVPVISLLRWVVV